MSGALVVLNDAPPVGPLEQAVHDLWATVWAKRFSPRGLWTRAKLMRSFNLEFIRLGQVRVTVPHGRVPDCDECLELCCTGENALVSLRLPDIARLCDQGLSSYVVHERPPEKGYDQGATVARREADTSVFHRMFPVLRRDATGTCALLTDERTCGVWPHWPVSCARYPYALDALSKEVFWAKGCRSFVTLPSSEAPPHIRRLVRAAVEGYNQRIRDLFLVHLALEELHTLGLTAHLALPASWRQRLPPAPAGPGVPT